MALADVKSQSLYAVEQTTLASSHLLWSPRYNNLGSLAGTNQLAFWYA